MTTETGYTEIADGIEGNFNYDEEGAFATVAAFEPNIRVGISRGSRITVSFPNVSPKPGYENFRLHLSPDGASELAEALRDAAAEHRPGE